MPKSLSLQRQIAEVDRNMQNTVRRISNAAKQVCAAICLQRFCNQHYIEHQKLDALIAHLWTFASIATPDEFVEWESTLNSLALTDLHGKFDSNVSDAVASELLPDFMKLVLDVESLGMCDAYTANTDGPVIILLDIFTVLKRHQVPIPSLDEFTPSVQNGGWGMPVDADLLTAWRALVPLDT